MERGSTKHGPVHDEEMEKEVEPIVRDAHQPGRTEEWRETEPVDDPRELYEAEGVPPPGQEDIDLRSELARLLTRDEFPIDRAALLSILDEKGATEALVARVSELPEDQRFPNTHELLTAVGLSHPEEELGR